MSMQQPAPRRKLINVKTVLLLALLITIGMFCGFNLTRVPVIPFGTAPLIVVMLICFVLGVAIGWILKSIAAGSHHLAPDDFDKVKMER